MGTPTCDYSIYRTSWSQLLPGAIPFLVTFMKIGCHDNTPWPYYSPKVELSFISCFVLFAGVAEQLGDKASPFCAILFCDFVCFKSLCRKLPIREIHLDRLLAELEISQKEASTLIYFSTPIYFPSSQHPHYHLQYDSSVLCGSLMC